MLSGDKTINSTKDHSIKAIKRRQYDNLPTNWVHDWLLHVIKQPNHFLITDSDYFLSNEEVELFEDGINMMQAGTPLAYLIGQQAFWSLDFHVNEHTLIPRPDTEVLVEQVLAWINSNFDCNNQNSLSNNLPTSITKPFQLLDLGTGSGCIAISLAHELKSQSRSWQVTAVDYSSHALKVARQNAIINGTPEIDFIQSDWFESLPNQSKYHVITSNPPYIAPADTHLNKLSAEPISALIADNNGLADIRRIVSGAGGYLAKGGLLAIEHGFEQGAIVRQIFTDVGFAQVQTVKDYGGNDRVTMGEWRSMS